MNSLPLSWTINKSNEFSSKSINKNNICWIYTSNMNDENIFKKVISEYSFNKESNLLIRGCNFEIRNELSRLNFYSLKVGMEAILDTSKNCFRKKSLIHLVKRGLRKGQICKLDYSIVNRNKLRDFYKISTHAKEPKLKNLFITDFLPHCKLYVLSNKNEWLGAILISQNSRNKIHTESIIRTKYSPIGTLEAIIHQIYEDAKAENIKFVSLGEVPFSASLNIFKDGFYSALINFIGQMLNIAYKNKGLFQFKNKFNPMWEPIFICSSNKISIKELYFLMMQTNFYNLIKYKLLKLLQLKYCNKKRFFSRIFIFPKLDFNKT
ncbi:MAG: DUF2156 domain-containing protein [Ignavibacteriae bacterium]|nr:DUF2156 domain-containing protein [Ignavibacteriota bacterium]